MNKCVLALIISRLKWAIWYLELVNRLKEDTIDQKIIDDLKEELILLKNKRSEEDEDV